MAAELVRRNIGLVYGGGNVGLMGIIADAVLRAGGEVQGIISEHLMAREVGHNGLTKLHVVRSMHERKGVEGRSAGCLRRSAGWIRQVGGVLRGGDVAAAWSAREAVRHPEYLGLLLAAAPDVRRCGGGAVPEA